MCSGDRLGVNISIAISMSSIASTVKFLSVFRKICFSENCQDFSFLEKFENMRIRFAMENCLQSITYLSVSVQLILVVLPIGAILDPNITKEIERKQVDIFLRLRNVQFFPRFKI